MWGSEAGIFAGFWICHSQSHVNVEVNRAKYGQTPPITEINFWSNRKSCQLVDNIHHSLICYDLDALSRHFLRDQDWFLFAVPRASVSFQLNSMGSASVSHISAERLQDPSGIDMAESGVLVLVADTGGDGFQGASPTAIVTADDYLVGMWDIATGGGNTPGAFQGTTGAVSFSGDWGEGDPLAIYWFPTLSLPSEAPGEAVPYGMYANGTLDDTDRGRLRRTEPRDTGSSF